MAVLDGHGGHRASHWLSSKILSHIHDSLEKERWRAIVADRSARNSLSDVFRTSFKELDGDLLDFFACK